MPNQLSIKLQHQIKEFQQTIFLNQKELLHEVTKSSRFICVVEAIKLTEHKLILDCFHNASSIRLIEEFLAAHREYLESLTEPFIILFSHHLKYNVPSSEPFDLEQITKQTLKELVLRRNMYD